jgi:DNA-binding LacI/PurR family transcriptional regulator
VFAANDMMALGAMSVIREAQLRVPDDIALVGFDNVPMTGLMLPGLTTMAMPMSALGGTAARLLEQQLALGGRHQSERHTFSAELIVRDSSLRPVGALA